MSEKDLLLKVVLLTCLVGTGLAVCRKRHRLTVRSSILDTKPSPAYIPIPHSTSDEGIDDYEQVWLEHDYCRNWDFYCLHDDARWCLIFDLKGFIAGMQISYLLDDIKHIDENIYNYSNPNFKDNIIFDTPVKSVQIFFTNPEELTEGGRNRSSKDVISGLWAHLDGEWVRFDYKSQPLTSVPDENFHMQGCGPKIGQLFARDFHGKANCQNGFFLYQLYENRRLIGFGHATPGLASPGPRINVYNHPHGPILQNIGPDTPPCFQEMGQYGFTVTNVFFIEDPWNIRCPKCHSNHCN